MFDPVHVDPTIPSAIPGTTKPHPRDIHRIDNKSCLRKVERVTPRAASHIERSPRRYLHKPSSQEFGWLITLLICTSTVSFVPFLSIGIAHYMKRSDTDSP